MFSPVIAAKNTAVPAMYQEISTQVTAFDWPRIGITAIEKPIL